LHALIQPILAWYFNILGEYGLVGVVLLMAMGSSILPVPSEMVLPPATVVYLNDVHRDAAVINVLIVILAGTLGSYIGSAITYWLSRVLGRPLVLKYGKYLLISESKLAHADHWMLRYGAQGIFIARLLPFARHVISIPAGIIGMRFRTFSLMTISGSALASTILAIFGLVMRKDMLVIIHSHGHLASPAETAMLQQAMNKLTLATLALVGFAMGCYWLLARTRKMPAIADLPLLARHGEPVDEQTFSLEPPVNLK
jgi:membrane protein DedA with SNARE-associated domain